MSGGRADGGAFAGACGNGPAAGEGGAGRDQDGEAAGDADLLGGGGCGGNALLMLGVPAVAAPNISV
ncbi:hypothetical protein AB0F17_56040 [Nonomuraea sp. NPDC026600]|uniref:hypothetical protein n=1 Tax=Nonomuraea sp. NPDC026600 TaxID=3155363 RepID=UPI003411F627